MRLRWSPWLTLALSLAALVGDAVYQHGWFRPVLMAVALVAAGLSIAVLRRRRLWRPEQVDVDDPMMRALLLRVMETGRSAVGHRHPDGTWEIVEEEGHR